MSDWSWPWTVNSDSSHSRPPCFVDSRIDLSLLGCESGQDRQSVGQTWHHNAVSHWPIWSSTACALCSQADTDRGPRSCSCESGRSREPRAHSRRNHDQQSTCALRLLPLLLYAAAGRMGLHGTDLSSASDSPRLAASSVTFTPASSGALLG